MDNTTDPSPPTPEAEVSMSMIARLTNVLAAPGEVFDTLKGHPAVVTNWLVPAVLYVVVAWICASVIFTQDWVKPQILEVQMTALDQQVEAGKMTEPQAEQTRKILEQYGMVGAIISGYAGPLVMGLAGPMLWGLFLWLVGSKILGGGFGYMKAVEVAGLTLVIATLGSVVKTLLILIQGNVMASVSPVLLVQDFDASNPLHTALGWLDAVVIWGLVLKAMGIARLAGRSTFALCMWIFGAYALLAGGLTALGLLVQKLSSG